MSTTYASTIASSNNTHADRVKASLQRNVQDHILLDVDTETFVKEVWGLPSTTILTITKSKLHATPNVEPIIVAYKNSKSLLHQHTDRDPALYLFQKLAATLLANICQTLGLNSDQAITTELWGTKESEELASHLYFMHDKNKKPDMLEMFKQADGYEAGWDDVRCSFEFKRQDDSLPEDDSIAESDDVACQPCLTSGVSESSSPGVVASHSEDTSPINLKGLAASGGRIWAGRKRTYSEISDALATSTNENHKKRRCIAVNCDDAQLFTYALECLSTGTRHYTTGFLIDKYWATIWYFDRNAVQRTTTFDFSTEKGILSLGLALFALSQCTMKQAGFDPYLHKLIAPQPGKPITKESVLPLLKPSASVKEKCYMFPISGSSSERQYIFSLVEYFYRSSGIVGRGTCVATVLVATLDNIILANLHALKMSWQYSTRKAEADIISHLRTALPEYWRRFLPEPVFSARYTAAQLDLPRSRMSDIGRAGGVTDDEHVRPVDRDLHIIVNPAYTNIWKARNVDEFKMAFLDCLECHHHCYTTGMVFHRDINESSLMIYRPGETDRVPGEVNEQFFVQSDTTQTPELNSAQPSRGILCCFDQASMGKEGGHIGSDDNHHHRFDGTHAFAALDHLEPRLQSSSTPKAHFYRHDLESFFYVLVWAAVHYKYSTGAVISVPTFSNWNGEHAFTFKSSFVFMNTGYWKHTYCLPEFFDLWESWITPLSYLFRRGQSDAYSAAGKKTTDYDYTTCNGKITFETFMAAIGETPRGLNPASDTA
ncbi:hypothetical protein HYPSUDRAFT_485513 [Hypholoma sublateritium FD-334 SS-4]|uniref:Fungal-type protein kinase domain-containing protein n=1 Tax=Hypholoma sublateritium (strain FD-334 SS-4) TaxID=945553 RepID=A0A0D2NZF8_HYPSF|nr:hypothetical protein HYPSUDRAFT_485513 [Hypholoma sublateritium FD-334 SS-4]